MFENVEFETGKIYTDCKSVNGVCTAYTLKIECDDYADLSHLGEFNDKHDDNAIDTHKGELYRWRKGFKAFIGEDELSDLECDENNIIISDHIEVDNDIYNVWYEYKEIVAEVNTLGYRSYQYFHPSYVYRMEDPYKDPQNIKIVCDDYKRMLAYGNDWQMIYIMVEAYQNGESVAFQSLGGIESDSGEDYFREEVINLVSEIDHTLGASTN